MAVGFNPAYACRTGAGWRQADKPQFDVQHLTYKLKGNNVPMPSTLVKHLLRVFIPEIIQVCRRLRSIRHLRFTPALVSGRPASLRKVQG